MLNNKTVLIANTKATIIKNEKLLELANKTNIKEAKKYALSILYSNIGITKQVDQIGLIELFRKYSIDEIVDYVSFQGLNQTLEAFYEIDNLDFGIEENKSSINSILSKKNDFVKIKYTPKLKVIGKKNKDNSKYKKQSLIKNPTNYEKEISQYFYSFKEITSIDQIDIDKLKKYLSYSNRSNNTTIISQSYCIFGKISNLIDEKNEISKELSKLKNTHIYDNFNTSINKIISSPDCDAQGIGNMFYGLQNSEMDISKELLEEIILKLISLDDCNIKWIGNTFYGLKDSIVDISKETLKKLIDKIISLPYCDIQGIGNMFYGLKNSKVDISKETLEKIINKLILLPDYDSQGIGNMFYGLKNSKVDISKETLEKVIKKFISSHDCSDQGIGNTFYGLKNSKIDISKEVLEEVTIKLISSPECNHQSIGNMFYGFKNSKIDISKEVLEKAIIKLISDPECNHQSIGNMFYGFKNSKVDISKEVLEKVIIKLISSPECNHQSIGNMFYGFKNSKIDISKELLEKTIIKLISDPGCDNQSIGNMFYGLQNTKIEISNEIIDTIKNNFSCETFLPLFKRLELEQFNNLINLKGLFSEKYQIELELMKLYKESKYEIGLNMFENLNEYKNDLINYKIKYLRKLNRYDEIMKLYGKSTNSLNIESQIEMAYVLFNNNQGKESLKIFGDIINKKMGDSGRITRLYTGIIFCLGRNNGLMDDFGKNLFEIAIEKIKSIDINQVSENEAIHIAKAINKAKYIKN